MGSLDLLACLAVSALAASAIACAYDVPSVVPRDAAADRDGGSFSDSSILPYEGGLDAGGVIDGPSCGPGLVCAPSPPSGWSFVTLTSDSQGICPTGYGNNTILKEGLDAGPAPCSCQCQLPMSNSSNCYTNAPMTFTFSATAGACTLTGPPLDANNNCASFGGSLSGQTFGQISPAPPQQTPCPATVTTGMLPPVASAATWRSCAASSPPSSNGCAAGETCVPQVPPPFIVCVAASGVTACPPGYQTIHSVGSGVDDTRMCTGTCACETQDTCINASVLFFKLANCSGGVTASLNADGMCDSFTVTGSTTSYRYAADLHASNMCTPTQMNATPTGGVALNGLETVCCP